MTDTARILEWSRAFRSGQLTVEDIQDRFAALDVQSIAVPESLRKALTSAQQELDAIRFGMCEDGQRGEILRIFAELEQLIRRAA